MMTKFTRPTKKSEIERGWHLIDVNGKILGRAATEIAQYLMGKSKPYFAKNLDCGDYVVVINVQEVAVSGKKEKDKLRASMLKRLYVFKGNEHKFAEKFKES